MTIKRIFVTGRVQAVGFRDWVVRSAKTEGITGWVRNRNDGSVEMVASGEEEAVGRFAEACREGPSLARVDHVEVIAADDEKPGKGFTKRFTA
jgi:acylphosphatase